VRVLAVDTATPCGSLAVAGPGGVLAEVRLVAGGGHSGWVLPAAQALLVGLGLEAGALDLFAVTIGPGSFTGLRVGLGTVQGLAVTSGRPCVGLSTLDVMALSAAGTSGTIVALIDAFRGEVYSGVYDSVGTLRGERRVSSLASALVGVPAGAAFVGHAALARADAIRGAVAGAVFVEKGRFLAADLALAARRLAAAGWTLTAAELQPLYLRDAGARKPGPS
jgi:tRNA threonylcarbamoyladenosine biosynthesis protein TsaB